MDDWGAADAVPLVFFMNIETDLGCTAKGFSAWTVRTQAAPTVNSVLGFGDP